jgi:hypothetical protein
MRQTLSLHAAALAVGVVALSGCAPTLPVLVHPVECPIAADQLAKRCAEPQAIADGATYGEVLQHYQLDRKALRDCAAHDRLLAEMIGLCQRAIQDYNARLDEINRHNAGKP